LLNTKKFLVEIKPEKILKIAQLNVDGARRMILQWE
jgi:hypothetical protein